MKYENKILSGDKQIWGIFFCLVTISVIEMFSASSTLAYRASDYYSPAFRHIMMLVLGTVVAIAAQNIRLKHYISIGLVVLLASGGMLCFVFIKSRFFGGGLVNDSARYLMGFQPSEMAKFGLISFSAQMLSKGFSKGADLTDDEKKKREKLCFRYVLGATALICGLIFPENFSTSVLLASVIYCMMVLAKVQLKRLLIIGGVVATLILVLGAFLFVTPDKYLEKIPGRWVTWKYRVFDPSGSDKPLYEQAITDKNMQIQFGRMAVANSDGIGKMPGNSLIRDFLPQAYSDYIFSIIIEELGLVGATIVMILYLWLMFRAFRLFRRSNNTYAQLLMLGLVMLIAFQSVINMAVGVDLGPVTGQPLPLLSRGGTSTVMTCFYFGVIIGISSYIHKKEAIEAEKGQAVSEEEYDAEIDAREEAILQENAVTDESDVQQEVSGYECYSEEEQPEENKPRSSYEPATYINDL